MRTQPKKERIGEVRRNKQGLTTKIIGYHNNKNVTIEFVETGEVRKTSYIKFCRGEVMANLKEYPLPLDGIGCSLTQFKWIIISLSALFLGGVGAIVYALLK